MQHQQSQADRVLSRFGTDLNQIAQDTGYPYKRLWNWKSRGSIPQEWHQPLLDLAAGLGVGLVPQDFVAHLRWPVAAPETHPLTGQE